MSNNIFNSLFAAQSPQVILTAVLADVIAYLPRLIVALIVFLFGKMIANYLANGASQIVKSINVKKIIESFELGISIPPSSENSLAQLVGLIVRYMALYLTLVLTCDILGLSGLSQFLRSLALILPKVLSSVFIILLGIIASGVIEALIKKALLEIDPATARLGGKIASYVTIGFFVLMGLAELGLASFFVNTLFIGFVASISLAFALSIGLGSKDVVNQTLNQWYKSRSKKK